MEFSALSLPRNKNYSIKGSGLVEDDGQVSQRQRLAKTLPLETACRIILRMRKLLLYYFEMHRSSPPFGGKPWTWTYIQSLNWKQFLRAI